MKLLTLKPSARTLTMLAVVTVLLCVSGILIYMVGSKQLRSATGALQDKQKQVEDSTKTAKRLAEAQANYLKAQSELGCLETSVSTYAYVPTLLGQLDNLGKAHNLRVVSVRPEPAPAKPAPIRRTSEDSLGSSESGSKTDKAKNAEKPKPYEELKIEVQLEGTYWCVHDFMNSLTRFPKIIAVKSIEMTPAREAERRGSPGLQVKLVLTAFIFKEEKAMDGIFKLTEPKPPATNKAAAADGRSSDEG